VLGYGVDFAVELVEVGEDSAQQSGRFGWKIGPRIGVFTLVRLVQRLDDQVTRLDSAAGAVLGGHARVR
jgi:hypothetical protein